MARHFSSQSEVSGRTETSEELWEKDAEMAANDPWPELPETSFDLADPEEEFRCRYSSELDHRRRLVAEQRGTAWSE